jgi:HSP20 family molecular chaperone IbpA
MAQRKEMEANTMSEEQALQLEDTEKLEVEETGAERTRDRLAFVPRVDIYETDEAITVVADLPGVDENSIDITLEKNVLTLNAYVEPEEPEGFELAYVEYRVGDYQRAFTLSDQIDQEGIEATVNAGVLRLQLPKITEAKRRKIAITAG